MPEIKGKTIHIPVQPEDKQYADINTIPIDKKQGISAYYGRPEGSDSWEIKTYLFDTTKGWDMERARNWVKTHKQSTQSELPLDNVIPMQMGTEAIQDEDETPLTKTEPIVITAADLPKYVEVRQHPPSHFTSYQHQYHNRAKGIIKSVGKWRKTGAVVVQKFLFRRDHGWTEESVKEWFKEHPEFRHPEVSSVQEVRDTLIDIPCTLQLLPETDNGKTFTMFDVIIIREGFGKNFRLGADGRRYQDYFTREFLQSLVPLLEGTAVQSVKLDQKGDNGNSEPPDRMKVVIQELKRHGHPPDIVNLIYDMGLSGNVIGLLKDVEYQELNELVGDELIDGAVDRGKFHLATGSPHAEDSRRLFQLAWQQGLKKSLGLSVNYRANAEFTEIDGRPAFKFIKATRHVSTETVINPAAGGGIVRVLQGVREIMNNEKEERVQEDEETPVPDEKEQQLELAVTQAEEPEVKQEEQTLEPPPGPALIERTAEPILQQNPDIIALQRQIVALTEGMEVQDAALQRLTESMTVQGSALQIIEDEKRKNVLKFMVSQSQLPAETKTALTTQIDEDKLKSIDAVNQAIMVGEKTQEAVRAQQSAPVFPGLSGIHAEIMKDPKDVNLIRSKGLWDVPLTQAEEDLQKQHRIQPFHNWTEEYCTLTGDYGKSFQYQESYFQRQINPEAFTQEVVTGPFVQATILTTTYPDFLRNVISQRMRDVWSKIDMQWKKVVRRGDSFTDTRDEEDFIPGMVPEIPLVAENGTYLDGTNGAVEKVTSSAAKYGRLFVVTEDDILNDRLGFIKRRADSHIVAMYVTIAHKIWKLVLGFGTAVNNEDLGDSAETGISGGVLYHALRKNYVNGSINDSDKIKELVDLMMVQVDIAAAGETNMPLPLQPGRVVCKSTNLGWIKGRLLGEFEPGYTDNRPNKLLLDFLSKDDLIGLHPYYLHDKPDFLGMLPDPAKYDGIEVRYFRGQESPETLWENNQQPTNGMIFTNDQMRMRIKMRIRINRTQKKAFNALFEP
jgi:hypothetical protein